MSGSFPEHGPIVVNWVDQALGAWRGDGGAMRPDRRHGFEAPANLVERKQRAR
ncbi:MAG: hypothetical protein ACRED2_12735 [Methylocella sp.]